MNNKIKLVEILGVVLLGLLVSILFVHANWTPPISSPAVCKAGDPGCDAPINAGAVTQYKNGALGIGGILHGYSTAVFDGIIQSTVGGIKFPDGTVQTTAAVGGGSGISGYEIKSQICGSGSCTVSCSSGKIVLSGGCLYSQKAVSGGPNATEGSYPSSNSSWKCYPGYSSGGLTAYAICANP